MVVTLVIAIVGAITGVIGTIMGLVALLRDRPLLEAHQDFDISRQDSTVRLVVYVVNNGRQPATVFRAGFGTGSTRSRKPPWRVVRVSAIGSVLATTQIPELPARLEPGGVLRMTLDLISPGKLYKPDKLPRGFVMDTRKRMAWAKPRLSDDDWNTIYKEFDWSNRKPAASADG